MPFSPRLAPHLNGRILTPEDPGYDEARQVFNGLVDRRPERILRPGDTDEVAAAVELAVGDGRLVSVYGGGHGVTGAAVVDGGVCIDLRELDKVEVWPEERLLKVGGGARWGPVDAATQAHGLAVTGGRVSTTGVAGLALGSGSGWLERRCGLTCDNLVEARVVTAEGRRVTASREQNPDLFWGCAVAAATSASSPSSSSGCTTSARSCSAACCSTPARRRPTWSRPGGSWSTGHPRSSARRSR